jgi:DNA-nicking Smr family endonuclease
MKNMYSQMKVQKCEDEVMSRVAELNLETGMPTAAQAVAKLKNQLTTFKGKGVKAVIIIHGYGSTGTGGIIRNAVRRELTERSLHGIVKAFYRGEEGLTVRMEAIQNCGSLKDFERRVSGNEGVTVVVLRT